MRRWPVARVSAISSSGFVRYMACAPLTSQRLSIDGDGLGVHELKRPFRDGTTHCLFEPLDFLAPLAAWVPRPRPPLIRYHGVFAPHARHRAGVLGKQPPEARVCTDEEPMSEEPMSAPPGASMTWMQRLRGVFDIDLSLCSRCGWSVNVLVLITEPAVIASLLGHLAKREARAPPAVA
ncbi:MAG: hypothetical protein GKR94_19970 [Gammaproteobacteria bacterium]|nr:hypothetical protein [Gammaproteobacteria bacterium]